MKNTEDSDFDFKFVPVEDFKSMLKSVRRQRAKKKDEAKWEKLMAKAKRIEERKARNEESKRMAIMACFEERMRRLQLEGDQNDLEDDSKIQLENDYGNCYDEDFYEEEEYYDEEDNYSCEDFIGEMAEGAPVLKGCVIQSARSDATDHDSQPAEWDRQDLKQRTERINFEDSANRIGTVGLGRKEATGLNATTTTGRTIQKPAGLNHSTLPTNCPCNGTPRQNDMARRERIPDSHGEEFERGGQPTDVSIHFVQQNRRSYVSKVEDGVSAVDAYNFHQVAAAEDLSRIGEQCCRIKSCLLSISHALRTYKPDPEDIMSDPVCVAKIRKRTQEFAARFTRNYLCEIRRQMSDIKKQFAGSDKQQKVMPLLNKFSHVFQLSLQAVLTLEKSTPTIFLDTIPPQVHEFLQAFTELCYLSNSTYCDGTSDKLQEMEDLGCQLDSLLLDFSAKPKKPKKLIKSVPKKTKSGVPTICTSGGVNVTTTNLGKRKDHYFMYKTNANCFERAWKKRSSALAKSKFGNNSKKKLLQMPENSSGSIHGKVTKQIKSTQGCNRMIDGATKALLSDHPPCEKPTTLPSAKSKRKLEILDEANIKTMVEMMSPTEVDENNTDLLFKKLNRSLSMSQPSLFTLKKQNTTVEGTNQPMVDEAMKTMLVNLMAEALSVNRPGFAPNGDLTPAVPAVCSKPNQERSIT